MRVCPRLTSCSAALCAVVACILALALPATAAAAPIQPNVHINRGQVTVVWTSSFVGTSELRWDAKRATGFATFPTSNDESNTRARGLRHSRTISDLEAGDYWLAVRTTALNGAVEESGVVRITVTPELGAGSMGQLDIDGAVTSTNAVGNRTFLGGDFARVGIRTGAGVVVSSADDESRGDVIPGMPQINGIVHTSTSDDRGGWYIGGDFTRVGGLEMRGVAHLFPDGGVDPDFTPGRGIGATGSVRALDVDAKNFTPPRLYIGGAFSEYDGSPQNNIVAVNGATGQRDTSFVTTAGVNTGTNAPVFAIKVDERLRGTGADFEKSDYSGVYIAGAFTYFRGMAMSRIAKLELSGNRARYSKTIPIDESPEWSVIKSVVGTDAFTQTGWFESCGYGTPQSTAFKCELMHASAFRPNPVDDLDQAYAKEQVFAKTVNIGPVVTTIEPGAPMRAITSLDSYEQFRCATGMPMYPKPNGFLADIPLIGWFISLSNAASAALNPNSPANRYMSDFMYDKVVRSYDQTLLFGGRFENSDRTTTSTTLSGFNAASGTQNLTSSDPSMSRLESFFPNLGTRLRADMTMVSSRLDQSGIDGTLNSLVVSDAAGCDNDQAYVGGDFSFATDEAGVLGADIGRVNLTKVYDSKWKIDPTWHNVRTGTVGKDGKSVGTISLDNETAPKQLTGAGTFTGIASNGTVTDRAGIVMLDVQTGEFKVQGMRDGADGAVLTVNDSGGRAFVGGDFTAYDSWKRSGLAAISTTGGAANRISIDKGFAPKDRIGGDDVRVTSMTSAAGRLFVGGRFSEAGGNAHANLVAYDLATGARDTMITRAGGGPRGRVDALASTNDGRVIVGGDFDGYVARDANGAEVASCTCRNLVVLHAATGLPFGMQPGGGGAYRFADVDTNGPVQALALDAAQGRLYVGGDFDRVGSSDASFGGLLGVNLATGTIDEAFHATAGGTNGVVNVLAVSGDDLLVAGDFDQVRGASAANVAKLDLATGQPDPKFNPPYRVDAGTDGPVTSMVLIGNIVVIGGDFTEYNGSDRPGLATIDVVTGNAIGGSLPGSDQEIVTIGLIGDEIVIAYADGTTSTISVKSADTTSPVITADPANAIAGGVLVDGTRFVRGGAGAELTISVDANDQFQFDDLYNGGSLGLQTITWPAIPGVAPAREDDMTTAKRLRLRCTGTGAGGAAVAPLELDVSDIAWTTANRPAGLDRFAGTADCTWTGKLVVPTNASADFALIPTGAMTVTSVAGSSRGRTVPITVSWNAMPTNANPRLSWNDSNAGFGATPRAVPAAAFAPLEPFSRTYKFPDAGVPDGRYDGLAVTIVDQAQNAGSVTLDPITIDSNPPVASTVRLPAGAPKVSTGTVTLQVQLGAGDGAGSGVQSRIVELQTAAFATSGDARCAPASDPDVWTTVPGASIAANATGNQQIDVSGLPEGCHQFRLVSTDRVGLTRTDLLDVPGGWAHVDVAGPVVDTAHVPAAIEGDAVLLGGTLQDTGAGVDRFDVDIVGTERWDLCADATTTNTWSCAFDTTGADDGAYDVAVQGIDRLDQATESVVRGIHVDNVGPVVQVAVPAGVGTGGQLLVPGAGPGDAPTLWFNPNEPGSFRLDAVSVDDGFGGTVLLPQLGMDPQSGWDVPVVEPQDAPRTRTAAGRKASAAPTGTSTDSRTYTWAAGASEPGLVTAVGAETAGKTGAASLDVRADGDAPTGIAVALDAADAIVVTPGIDAGAGVDEVVLERRETGIVEHSTCDTTWGAWTTLPVSDFAAPVEDTDVTDLTCYEYRVVATDRVGNRAAVKTSAPRLVGNPAAPAAPAPVVPTPAPVTPDPTPATPDPEPVTPDPAPEPKVVEPVAEVPTAVVPEVTKPTVLRETVAPEPVEPPTKDEPATRAPVETNEPAVERPAATDEPTTNEPAREVEPGGEVATGTAPDEVVTAKPKPKVAAPEVATTEPVASAPQPKVPVKKTDKSWVSNTIGWVKEHPLSAAAIGVAGAHVGSSLLFGKGLGALLAKLQGALGGHHTPPMRLLREIGKRGRNFWNRRRRRDDEDEQHDVEDEDDFDAFDDRRAA